MAERAEAVRHDDVDAHDAGSIASLLVFVVGYNLAHHNGLIGTTAAGGGTRIADWVDLLTPFVVVLPVLFFLWCQRVSGTSWLAAAVGSIVYVEGHGIHLAANSISNVGPGPASIVAADEVALLEDVVHLWDEVVGHYIWYGGLAILLATCVYSVRGRQLGVPVPVLAVGGGVSGLTWATNGLEGGTAVASLCCAGAALAWSARGTDGLRWAVGAGSLVAVAILGVYGVANGGFPQPSSL